MKKSFVALLLALVMVLGLVPSSMAEETKVLKMLWFSDGMEGVVTQGLIDEYEAQNPGIEIEIVEVAYADYENKLKTLLQAGEQPALARTTNIRSYADYLVDLNDYLPEDFITRFADANDKIIDGRLVAVPMEFAVVGMVYNKTAFDKAGVKAPSSPEEVWTWEEYEEAMKKVIADGGVKYGLVVDKTCYRFAAFMYAAGGTFLNEDLTAANFNTPEARRAVQWFYDLHKNEIIPTSVWLGAENPNNLFRSGQVACHVGGSWLITNYDKEITDFEWGITYLPKDKIRATISGSKSLTAFEGTGLEKEAADFIEWFTRPENFSRYCEPNYFINGVVSQEQTSSESKYAADFAVFSNEVASNASPSGNEWNTCSYAGLISADFVEQLSAVLSDQMSIDDFMVNIHDLINETIADYE